MSALNQLATYARSSLALGATWRDRSAIFGRQTKNLRVRLGIAHHHPDQTYRIQTIYGPLTFRDNFGDITNLANLFYKPVYQLTQLSHPGVILDVGANIGLAAAWFAFHNPDRAIYCFEPLPANAALIAQNCPQAHINCVALGAQPGEIALQVDADSVMASTIDMQWQTQAQTFTVTTLDAVVAESGITEVALLKLDTEGMELEIFAGGRATLAMTHQIVMETHGVDRHEASLTTLYEAGFGIDSAEFDGHTGLIFAQRSR